MHLKSLTYKLVLSVCGVLQTTGQYKVFIMGCDGI